MRTRAELDSEFIASMQEMRELARTGHTAPEISDVMDLTPHTVRQRARRAGIELVTTDAAAGRPCRCHTKRANGRDLGHKFGPDLSCEYCGSTWDEQQETPAPCFSLAPVDDEPLRPGMQCARPAQTECTKAGHPYPENRYTNPTTGASYCQECRRIAQRLAWGDMGEAGRKTANRARNARNQAAQQKASGGTA